MSALYRRYRPQTFAQLDNEKARTFFQQLISSGRVAHAYLFTGPKGTGKTTSARLVAKGVNCLATTVAMQEPCNECESCQAINDSSCVDVLEIDAASNRGIDEMRALRERVILTPGQVRQKVYIIDEVHMLTTEAFNALLKTLEEPPLHALFVLCTTEPHKVPETVVSRCQEVIFERATPEEITRSISRVLSAEKLNLDAELVSALVVASDGSFRDAIKLLDQLLAASGSPTVLDLEAIRRSILPSDRAAWLTAVFGGDGAGALASIQRWEQGGVDFITVAYDLLYDLRVCFLLKQGVSLSKKDTPRVTVLTDMVKTVTLTRITELLRMVADSFEAIRSLPMPAVVLELVVGEWMLKYGVPSQSDKAISNSPLPSPDNSRNAKAHGSPNQALTLEEIATRWSALVKVMKTHNRTVGTIIQHAKPKAVSGNSVTVEVLYAFHRDRLEQLNVHKLLGEASQEVFGMPLTIRCEIGVRPMRKRDVANVDVPMGDTEVLTAVADIFGEVSHSV